MQIIKYICLFVGLIMLSTGCSNVRKAVYDKDVGKGIEKE